MIVIQANGRGEIAFGALEAALDIEYGRSSIGFTWNGPTRWIRSRATAPPNCSTTARIEIELSQ
jgi:hypothetical protein